MKKRSVSIQGLKGSFHHEAALHFFGDEIEVVECETFKEVVSKAASSEVDFGLMAIENSLAVYKDKLAWKKLMITAMLRDSSWDHSAIEYIRLYRQVSG